MRVLQQAETLSAIVPLSPSCCQMASCEASEQSMGLVVVCRDGLSLNNILVGPADHFCLAFSACVSYSGLGLQPMWSWEITRTGSKVKIAMCPAVGRYLPAGLETICAPDRVCAEVASSSTGYHTHISLHDFCQRQARSRQNFATCLSKLSKRERRP